MQAPLISSMILTTVSALAFVLVGRAVMRRPVSPELRLARNAFATWWYALGTTTLIGGLQTLLWISLMNLDLYSALALLNVAIVCLALWGLLYYLVFLFTNSSRFLWPLSIGYALYFFLLTYYVTSSHYDDVLVTRWALRPHPAHDLTGSPLFLVVIALLLVPQILAAFAYLTFYWRVDDPVQKRRILLVSMSILVWFSSALVGSALGTGVTESDTYQLVSKLIGLTAAAAIYYAYTGLGRGPGATSTGSDSFSPKPAEGNQPKEVPRAR